MFFGAALAQHCPYCDGALVKSGLDFTYPIDAVLPFAVDEDTATQALRRWLGARIFAPSDLQSIKDIQTVGLYVPFWSFDMSESVTYSESVFEGDERKEIPRSANLEYTNVLYPASPHITTFIRDAALDLFDVEEFRPYDPGFLAGFSAERHHMAVDTAKSDAESDFHFGRRAAIHRLEGIALHHIVKIQPTNTRKHYRRVLLPVWMMRYDVQGKTYTAVVSGHDHSVFGERPVSRLKLGMVAALLAVPLVFFGLWYGITYS